MPRPLRVFLCHASQDKPIVWKLYRYLKLRGVKPWLDQADLLPGEDWEVEIPRALFASDVILVCLSKNSVNKEGFVQKEITFALDKALEKPEGTIFIIPVKLEECEIPRRLTRYQWVDLSRPDGRKRLLMGLNKRVNELGEEVKPVIVDDTRQRMPKPTKLETEEQEKYLNQIQSNEEVPITTFLAMRDENKDKEKSKQKARSRWLGIGGIILLVLIFGGFGLNYLLKNMPIVTATVSPLLNTPTIKSPTLTSAPITSTPQPTKTSIPTPALGIGSTMISPQDDMVLVYVPAGEFTMGISSGDLDERPEHQVDLKSFWIDQTEVTNGMYTKCVEANQCNPPAALKSMTRPSYFGNTEFDDYPVIYVDWSRANDYCYWVGRRLPTESEWEKSARGIDGRIYPWSSVAPKESLLNYDSNIGDTTEVGKYPAGASIYGALDMAGNVWEWVEDWYDASYYQNSPLSNPLGSDLGIYRVLRGGSWNSFGEFVRSTLRNKVDPSSMYNTAGFRCARSP